MDREKVIELAREAEILRQLSMEVPFVVDRLERFAALIEREVRGDAEPVAWMTQSNDLLPLFHKTRAAAMNWESRPTPLYTHPSPAVVRQLVDAAKRAMNYAENVVMAEGVSFDYDDDLPFIESALLAAKEAGL